MSNLIQRNEQPREENCYSDCDFSSDEEDSLVSLESERKEKKKGINQRIPSLSRYICTYKHTHALIDSNISHTCPRV